MKQGATHKKKLMLLGGLRYLLPVIDAAHKLGIHVITCDYLPDNIAHKYSDEYCNVSIIDKEAVLAAARELQIDGIMSFAVDPGVVSAAYVQQEMGLPGCPYESVCILQNKDRFREFLRAHGFNCPWSFGFASVQEALDAAEQYTYPAIVKPTDSAGSKGVGRVDSPAELPAALQEAMRCSLSGHIIVEQFIEKVGDTTGSDSFAVDGELRFVSFDDQVFDPASPNPYTPSAHCWPSTMPEDKQAELRAELQRLISLLNLGTSIFNIEARVGTDGKVYIMEVSPRGGGNRLAEVIRMGAGVDLITASVRAAVGLPVQGVEQKPFNGAWAIMALHAPREGVFHHLEISPAMQPHVVEEALLVKPGDTVHPFRGANDAIGHLILHYDTRDALTAAMRQMEQNVRVVLSE
ncbi:MAG: ATP-grasp domain-containing protein [Akkermansia sp.]|nr:ATP-grasp domain-containing protein [Akkermansia sp.]